MLIKEYRICMPLSVEEYKIGQLYMIAKHSHEQSEKGEGVEVVRNEACHDPIHGDGQYTEKRVHLSNRLPSWIRAVIPDIFYITEKAWNYFPYTVTEYTCSFIPKYSICIETRYENNNGSSENCLQVPEEDLQKREVDFVDIAYDEIPPKHYKEEEDLIQFKSEKTGRGPLAKGWREQSQPIMCSYKLVRVKFEVFGLQGKVESFTHKMAPVCIVEHIDEFGDLFVVFIKPVTVFALENILGVSSSTIHQFREVGWIRDWKMEDSVRDILLVGHRQAFAWIDDWFGMSLEDIREYEARMNEVTNQKVLASKQRIASSSSRHSSTASRHSSTASASE